MLGEDVFEGVSDGDRNEIFDHFDIAGDGTVSNDELKFSLLSIQKRGNFIK